MNKHNLLGLILKIAKDTFLRATIWVFLGVGILSFGSYLFHLITARMLGPVEYGVLESVISVLYLLSVPLLTLNLIIIKYVSSYKGKNDYESINAFYHFFQKKFLKEGIIFCLLLILISPIISSFLHLSSFMYGVVLSIFVFTGLFLNLGKGMLQGLSNFAGLAAVNTVESIVKIAGAILLILIGLKALGGLAGIVLSAIIAYFVAIKLIGLKKQNKAVNLQDKNLIGKYTIPTFFTTLGLMSLFTSDVLLARHFLKPEIAGYYAALSVLGKIVFFAVNPVTLVMFPFVSEKYAKGEKYFSIFLMSIILTVLGALSVVLMFYLFPNLIVGLLFGDHFLNISNYAWLFGIFISIYCLCSLLANFFLSIHKTFSAFIVILASILQIILLTLFHSSISEMIYVNIAVMFLLLILLLLYYANANSRK